VKPVVTKPKDKTGSYFVVIPNHPENPEILKILMSRFKFFGEKLEPRQDNKAA